MLLEKTKFNSKFGKLFSLTLCWLMSVLPIVSYITTLYLIAISRISLGFLAMINVGLIHPFISVPFGILAKFLSERISKFCGCCKVIQRLATFSINMYFTFIAVIIAYTFKMWILTIDESDLQSSYDLDFKNQGFDLCTCKLLKDSFNTTCANVEANLQNYLNTLPIDEILYFAILIPLFCHLIQSICVFLPAPIHMVDFLIGNCDQSEKDLEENDFELEDLNQVRNANEVEFKPSFKLSSGHYLSSILISILFLGFVFATCNPIGFTIFLKESSNISSNRNQC